MTQFDNVTSLTTMRQMEEKMSRPLPTSLSSDSKRDLVHMHNYMRPDNTFGTKYFTRDWIDTLSPTIDARGNRIVAIGKADVMWSSHFDTVHAVAGFQKVSLQQGFLGLSAKSKKHSTCLGADDTVGVWLMREMILANRPGLYVFHRGEEVGGIGSEYISEKTPEIVKGVKAAIAFDRKGRSSIITHQWGGRCCSEAFATSLGDLLMRDRLKADSSGTFTDTANYTHLIPECTNISVGYFDQHTDKECLDVEYALELRDALLSLDTDKLVIERDPSVTELSYESYDWRDYRSFSTYKGNRSHGAATFKWNGVEYREYDDQEPAYVTRSHTLERLITDYPDVVADFLESQGYGSDDVIDHMKGLGLMGWQ